MHRGRAVLRRHPLGAAGLVRAYAAAAAAGLEAAGVATYVLHAALKARIDYPYFGKVERLLEDLGARVVDANYTDAVEVQLVTPAVRADAVIQGILNVTNGTRRSTGWRIASTPRGSDMKSALRRKRIPCQGPATGRRSSVPARISEGLVMPLSRASSSTVVRKRMASSHSVSPGCTL